MQTQCNEIAKLSGGNPNPHSWEYTPHHCNARTRCLRWGPKHSLRIVIGIIKRYPLSDHNHFPGIPVAKWQHRRTGVHGRKRLRFVVSFDINVRGNVGRVPMRA
ncbi:hypothetical protein EVAR_18349_1 [Eumeta japonica]|uniref:Uncharacterized protein n=1 Tax=Eumeta variegata TaxID=151549 RepID=A0A4C1V8Z0_EUMVA|nr:hypothetical protein EVAR_18349_1 [Eumeta japonica]